LNKWKKGTVADGPAHPQAPCPLLAPQDGHITARGSATALLRLPPPLGAARARADPPPRAIPAPMPIKPTTPSSAPFFLSPLELQLPLSSLHMVALARPPFSLVFLPFGLTAAKANSPYRISAQELTAPTTGASPSHH
jgi:hypothetical protein